MDDNRNIVLMGEREFLEDKFYQHNMNPLDYLSLSGVVNYHTPLKLKHIKEYCSRPEQSNNQLARMLLKIIKDSNYTNDESEFVINSIPFLAFAERGVPEKYMDYLGYSMYEVSPEAIDDEFTSFKEAMNSVLNNAYNLFNDTPVSINDYRKSLQDSFSGIKFNKNFFIEAISTDEWYVFLNICNVLENHKKLFPDVDVAEFDDLKYLVNKKVIDKISSINPKINDYIDLVKKARGNKYVSYYQIFTIDYPEKYCEKINEFATALILYFEYDLRDPYYNSRFTTFSKVYDLLSNPIHLTEFRSTIGTYYSNKLLEKEYVIYVLNFLGSVFNNDKWIRDTLKKLVIEANI